MTKYHKIQTVFKRDPENNCKTLLMGEYSMPEFRLLEKIDWCFTEKIDGTNIRVIWDGANVRFAGRTDKATIPPFLLDRLNELFPKEKLARELTGPVVLYGEGYGAKIQHGGNYIPDGVDFILFDVSAGGIWLERDYVECISSSLCISVVPIVKFGTLWDAVRICEAPFKSVINPRAIAEGLVMRPAIELQTRRGERIITKIKCKDFAHHD